MKVKSQQYLYLRLTNIVHQNNYLARSFFVLNCDTQNKPKETKKSHVSKNLSILFIRINPFVSFGKAFVHINVLFSSFPLRSLQ